MFLGLGPCFGQLNNLYEPQNTCISLGQMRVVWLFLYFIHNSYPGPTMLLAQSEYPKRKGVNTLIQSIGRVKLPITDHLFTSSSVFHFE
jgi:hypothetical protein